MAGAARGLDLGYVRRIPVARTSQDCTAAVRADDRLCGAASAAVAIAAPNAYFGYKRSGGYYVFVVQLHTGKPIEFGVKLPREPEHLGVANPYPNLRSAWYSYSRQWMSGNSFCR